MANYVAPVSGTWAAKGSSPFMASRSGGHRYHAGNDLQAANGSPAVAAIGGTVQYVGHNQGYQWNAVVMGDDGNAYRYATHGPLTVTAGQRVEAGQQVGTIARGHLHFEVIPPTSPAYKQMAAKPGEFVKTSYYPGGKASTIDPAEFFGVKGGTEIAAGQPVGGAAPQDAQSAIASLVAPTGGTEVSEMPSPLMAFSPGMPEVATPGAQPSAPPMPAPPKQLPPQWAQAGAFPPVAGNAGQNTMLGGTMPPMPQPRNQATLDQQRADQLDQMLFGAPQIGAGPGRGDFNRARPSDMFQVNAMSGAPNASAVPTPGISPLAPAVGGPNDRRPQPPMPNMRPGGAPDAASVPMPPPRGTPYAPDFPSLYGEQPGPPAPPMVAGRPEFPGALPAASRSGDMPAAMGGPPAPAPPSAPNPYDDISRRFDDLPPQIKAQERWDREQRLAQPPEPVVGNLNYSDMPSGRLPPSPGAVMDFGPSLGPYGASSPPAPLAEARTKDDPYAIAYSPDFNFAPTPSASGPQSGAMTGEGAPSAPNWQSPPGVSGMTYAPPMPAPPATAQMTGDQFNLSFSPGGPGVIMDMGRNPAPAPAPVMPFGAQPAYAGPQGDADWSPSNANAATIEQSPPPVPGAWGDRSNIPGRFTDAFAPPSAMQASVVRPPTPVPGQPGVSLPMAEGPMDIRSQAQGGPPMPAPVAALPAPPPAPRQTSAPGGKAGGIIGRILGGLLAGPAGALGGGLLGGGGAGFGFGGSAAFSPFAGSGGTAPSTGANGQAFNTTYRQGSVTGNPNMPGTMWNRSNGGSVGYVTDPFTGAMIYSSSPNTF